MIDLLTQVRAKLEFRMYEGASTMATLGAQWSHNRTAPVVEALLECVEATSRMLDAGPDYQLQREAEEDAREALRKLAEVSK